MRSDALVFVGGWQISTKWSKQQDLQKNNTFLPKISQEVRLQGHDNMFDARRTLLEAVDVELWTTGGYALNGNPVRCMWQKLHQTSYVNMHIHVFRLLASRLIMPGFSIGNMIPSPNAIEFTNGHRLP